MKSKGENKNKTKQKPTTPTEELRKQLHLTFPQKLVLGYSVVHH